MASITLPYLHCADMIVFHSFTDLSAKLKKAEKLENRLYMKT